MAERDTITTKFKVDVSELKAGISEANKQIKLANAEFKAAAAGMDDWSKSTDGLGAKIKQLKSVLDEEVKKLSNYNKQLEEQEKAYKENGKRADELRAKLKELADQGVSKTSTEYKKYKDALTQVEKEQASNKKAMESLNTTILNQKGTVNGINKDIKNYESALSKLRAEQSKTETASGKLKKTIESQESTLKSLKENYKNLVLEQGKTSSEAKELATQIDKLSSELKDNKTKLNDAGKAADELDKSLVNAGDGAKQASDGFTIMKGAVASLVADAIRSGITALKDFVKESINVGKEFDSAMSKVAAVSGATGSELDTLREKAKEMGSSTKFTASEAAEAFNYMAMAGWKTEDMLNGIDGVLNLAAASGADLATTSDIVTDALTAFGYSARDAGKLADVMAAASSNANTNVEMMGATFQYAAPIAGALGYTMEDTAVAIGLMANAGIKGEKAGTALRSVMTRLSAPPATAAKAMEELGISITNADGTMKPFSEVIEILRSKFDGLSESQQTQYAKAIAGQEAMSGLLSIVNASPADFDKLTSAVNNSNGAAENMANTMQDNLGGDLTKLKSNFEGLQLQLYEKLEPALRLGTEGLNKLVDAVKWCMDNLGWLEPIIIAVAGAFGLLAAKLAITAIINGVAKAFAALNAVMMANPITLIIGAIAALIGYFVYLWNTSEDFRNFWIGAWESIKNVALSVWNAITGFFTAAWDKINKVWSGLVDFFSGLWEGIKAVFSTIAEWIDNNIFKPIMAFFQPVIDFYKTAFELIFQFAEGCWNLIKGVWEVVSTWFNDNVIQPVVEFFTGLWNGIKEGASAAWDSIVAVWEVVSTWFNETIIQPISSFFTGMWDGLKEGAKNAWEGIKSVFGKIADWFKDKFTKAWEGVKKVFSTGGKIFSGIKEGIEKAFKTVVNAIIKGINKVIAFPFNKINDMLDTIRGLDLWGWKPFEGLISRFNVPQIPLLSQGGVLKRGQVGLLEGDGAEAVLPLEKNKGWIRAIANDMKKELSSGVKNNIESYKNTTINNFNQTINAPKQPSRIELYRQSRNLLNYLKGGNTQNV